MALPSIGAISIADYNVELKNASTTQLSMNDATFRDLAGVPGSQTSISMTAGYGRSLATTLTRTITNTWLNYDMRQDAINLGWDGVKKLIFTVTINNGVVVGSSSVGSYAFYISPTFPAGSILTVNNYGYIVGKGGTGGGGAYFVSSSVYSQVGLAGTGAGPAMYVGFATTISNGGVIGGGGGGGGGGAYGRFVLQ